MSELKDLLLAARNVFSNCEVIGGWGQSVIWVKVGNRSIRARAGNNVNTGSCTVIQDISGQWWAFNPQQNRVANVDRSRFLAVRPRPVEEDRLPPDIKILLSKQFLTPAAYPISGIGTMYWTFKPYLKINQSALVELDSLTSQFQEYEFNVVAPSGFSIANYIVIDPSTTVLQILEAWFTRDDIETYLRYFVAVHTYFLSGSTIAHYELPPVLEFFSPTPITLSIDYSNALDVYSNYLIPSYSGGADVTPSANTPPYLSSTYPFNFTETFDFLYQNTRYWIQIKNELGVLQNGAETLPWWHLLLNDRRYQIGTIGDGGLPLPDDTLPNYQTIRITESDLATIGVSLATQIYNGFQDYDNTVVGTIGSLLSPSFVPPDNRLYVGSGGEVKTSITLEAVRGIVN